MIQRRLGVLGVHGKGGSPELLPLHLCPWVHQEGTWSWWIQWSVERPIPAYYPREADLILGPVRKAHEPIE